MDALTTAPATRLPSRRWHSAGARFFPDDVADFLDLASLYRAFVVEGHAPAGPPLTEHDRVLTFGSCFADHLRGVLVETGFAAATIQFGAGLNNTFALRDFITWCCTGEQTAAGYRYERGTDGELAEYGAPEKRREYLGHIKQAAVLVFVLGLAEIWEDTVTGSVFWRGIPEDIYAAERHRSRLSTVAENVANLRETIAVLRRVNPGAKIVLALSPIPLLATYRPMSCITADAVSKSILRLALDEVVAGDLPGVRYWPSFEMVRWVGAHTQLPAFGDDGVARHPSDHVVSAIIDCFVATYYDVAAQERFRERRAERERRRGPRGAIDGYTVGNVIDFADIWIGPRHRRRGWSFVEAEGVWTEGAEATLSFTLNADAVDADLECLLLGEPFVNAEHPENGLRLAVNGTEIAEWRFSAPAATATLRAVLPGELVRHAQGRLRLSLTIDRPQSPAAVGLSSDARALGFFLRTLRISPADPGASRP